MATATDDDGKRTQPVVAAPYASGARHHQVKLIRKYSKNKKTKKQGTKIVVKETTVASLHQSTKQIKSRKSGASWDRSSLDSSGAFTSMK